MNKAYKFRIYPSLEQRILFAKTFRCVSFIYNKMLDDKIECYEQTKKYLDCYPSQYKAEYEWLKEVDSLALVGAYNDLKIAYNNFFRSPKVGFLKFKSKKHNHNSYTTNCVNNNNKLENGYLILPKVKSVIIKQHRKIPQDYKLKSVTVSLTPSGKYYASILFEYEKQVEQIELNNFVGLDFSKHELYVTSDNSSPCYHRFYRQAQEKLNRDYNAIINIKNEGMRLAFA